MYTEYIRRYFLFPSTATDQLAYCESLFAVGAGVISDDTYVWLAACAPIKYIRYAVSRAMPKSKKAYYLIAAFCIDNEIPYNVTSIDDSTTTLMWLNFFSTTTSRVSLLTQNALFPLVVMSRMHANYDKFRTVC